MPDNGQGISLHTIDKRIHIIHQHFSQWRSGIAQQRGILRLRLIMQVDKPIRTGRDGPPHQSRLGQQALGKMLFKCRRHVLFIP